LALTCANVEDVGATWRLGAGLGVGAAVTVMATLWQHHATGSDGEAAKPASTTMTTGPTLSSGVIVIVVVFIVVVFVVILFVFMVLLVFAPVTLVVLCGCVRTLSRFRGWVDFGLAAPLTGAFDVGGTANFGVAAQRWAALGVACKARLDKGLGVGNAQQGTRLQEAAWKWIRAGRFLAGEFAGVGGGQGFAARLSGDAVAAGRTVSLE
jgi:hypothetical protein